jgi:hypothetical protein
MRLKPYNRSQATKVAAAFLPTDESGGFPLVLR